MSYPARAEGLVNSTTIVNLRLCHISHYSRSLFYHVFSYHKSSFHHVSRYCARTTSLYTTTVGAQAACQWHHFHCILYKFLVLIVTMFPIKMTQNAIHIFTCFVQEGKLSLLPHKLFYQKLIKKNTDQKMIKNEMYKTCNIFLTTFF